VTTVTGQTQTLPGGAVASQEAIKEIGENGGGPYNANSAHLFENPNAITNLLQIWLLLAIPSRSWDVRQDVRDVARHRRPERDARPLARGVVRGDDLRVPGQ
jgi:hypothetical protein